MDREAVIWLYQVQAHCSGIAETRSALEEDIAKHESEIGRALEVAAVVGWLEHFEQCYLVPREVPFAENLLVAVADAGDPTAQVLLSAVVPEQFDTTDPLDADALADWEVKRYGYLKALAQHGYHDAMFTLGERYLSQKNPHLSEVRYPQLTNIDFDPEEGLAYMYAAMRLMGHDRLHKRSRIRAIREAEARLGEEAVRRSKARAREILSR